MTNYQYKNIQILQVSGIDTKKFLQGLTTADLNLLTENKDILFTAFANLKGRIISLCFVKFIDDNTLLLSVDEGVVEGLISWLKKYGMFSKVSFEVNTDYSLMYRKEGFLNHDIVKDSDQSNISFEEIQKRNIINKLAFINADNFEKFLPAELELDNLENVVCYTKGCYMGQEVIARMHYKAKLKKELAVVSSSSDIQTQDLKNADGKPLAVVVNRVFVDDKCYMLVVFHKEAVDTEYKLESGEIITKC
ncbi:amino acid transporter [Francisella sp. Scap27]|uniref:CAF17-like 4Fe-4S cluster assembly/insertion protein YgfZ n=1 Tax=Francisella sp. Scap27 TaxID=2589986 RepID=UPI0015BA41C8|nr:amino acid transporter [Francisella sp. Scap27]QLE78775.1 amino acid transporter [Francisella sp. Scap27]